MPTISRNALVPYNAADMYALVDDIESYPQFLPWCRSARVLARDEDEVRASIEISRSGLNKTFTTLNRLQKHKMIEIRLVEGPFRHLEGFWRFEQLREDACKVCLDMDFEFSSRIMGMMIGPVFSQIAGSMVDAFVARANDLYGGR